MERRKCSDSELKALSICTRAMQLQRFFSRRCSRGAVRLLIVGAVLLSAGLLGRWILDQAWMTASGSVATEGPIPCIVHQTWMDQQLPSSRARRWRGSWTRCLPDCRHMLWSDAENRRFIGMNYPWLLPTYECLKLGVQKSDLAKYAYLLHYGGVYADVDTVCLRDFRPLLHRTGLAFASMEGRWIRSVNGSYLQNSLMASRPGHPFWLALLNRIVAMHRQSRASGPTPPESTTGSLVLMEELQRYLNHSGTEDTRVFPPGYFNPFSWITGGSKGKTGEAKCRTMGGMNAEQEAACLAAYPEAYVVHLHAKSWGGGSL